jgi:hypothetical protein
MENEDNQDLAQYINLKFNFPISTHFEDFVSIVSSSLFHYHEIQKADQQTCPALNFESLLLRSEADLQTQKVEILSGRCDKL